MSVFCACCGGEEVIQDSKEPAAESQQVSKRRKNSKGDVELESHSAHAQSSSSTAGAMPVVMTSKKGVQSEAAPQLNFMHSKTLKLLTEVGELNNFQHDTYGADKLRKDLLMHADILARLENPTQFT